MDIKKVLIVVPIAIIITILLLGIFGLWLYECYVPKGEGSMNSARFFKKIKVLEPSIQYMSNGNLSFAIMNGAGQEVYNITAYFSGDECMGKEKIDGLNEGEVYKISHWCSPKKPISRWYCPTPKTVIFIIGTTFEYTKIDEGIRRIERDSGEIRGGCEW